ncbi:hypothetical protein R1flu_014008 [Riccia fluitans]|uniref:Uncharacterized protein n=1 Tax=Riccia fluitans TaxID=41844 RepID=A0ABD1YI09_9MARC
MGNTNAFKFLRHSPLRISAGRRAETCGEWVDATAVVKGYHGSEVDSTFEDEPHSGMGLTFFPELKPVSK